MDECADGRRVPVQVPETVASCRCGLGDLRSCRSAQLLHELATHPRHKPCYTLTSGLTSSARPALLVVEDDDILREIVRLVLAGEGYAIVLARSGEKGLAVIAEGAGLDGLYTDINLPGPVDGWTVGEVFCRSWPPKPIVYASARDWANARIMPPGVFLRKPFVFEQLVATLAVG
jgi:CheY-like chemotaxis protein